MNTDRLTDALHRAALALKLAERVARLNPDAGEIGPGMLAQLVADARAIFPDVAPTAPPQFVIAAHSTERYLAPPPVYYTGDDADGKPQHSPHRVKALRMGEGTVAGKAQELRKRCGPNVRIQVEAA